MLYNLYFSCYFSDIEAVEACFRILHVTWCDGDDDALLSTISESQKFKFIANY